MHDVAGLVHRQPAAHGLLDGLEHFGVAREHHDAEAGRELGACRSSDAVLAAESSAPPCEPSAKRVRLTAGLRPVRRARSAPGRSR